MSAATQEDAQAEDSQYSLIRVLGALEFVMLAHVAEDVAKTEEEEELAWWRAAAEAADANDEAADADNPGEAEEDTEVGVLSASHVRVKMECSSLQVWAACASVMFQNWAVQHVNFNALL
eukprot:3865677-Amphidinium_carterae.1